MLVQPKPTGYKGSSRGKLIDDLLNRELFQTPLETNKVIEWCKRNYSENGLCRSQGYRPPATGIITSKALEIIFSY